MQIALEHGRALQFNNARMLQVRASCVRKLSNHLSMAPSAVQPVEALGKPFRECWHEVYHILGPLVDTAFNGGPATDLARKCVTCWTGATALGNARRRVRAAGIRSGRWDTRYMSAPVALLRHRANAPDGRRSRIQTCENRSHVPRVITIELMRCALEFHGFRRIDAAV